MKELPRHPAGYSPFYKTQIQNGTIEESSPSHLTSDLSSHESGGELSDTWQMLTFRFLTGTDQHCSRPDEARHPARGRQRHNV